MSATYKPFRFLTLSWTDDGNNGDYDGQDDGTDDQDDDQDDGHRGTGR